MSALVGLFYLFLFLGLPVGLMWWLGRRWKTPLQRVIIIVVAMAAYGLLAWLLQHEKWEADAQVRELCAKDGGVKVYEQVVLPAERFDKWGNVDVPNKRFAKQSDEYYFELQYFNLREGNPLLTRQVTRLYRRSDNKILGEFIRYGRGGGDLPGPWHSSSFQCPSIGGQGSPNLIRSIFVREGDPK